MDDSFTLGLESHLSVFLFVAKCKLKDSTWDCGSHGRSCENDDHLVEVRTEAGPKVKP